MWEYIIGLFALLRAFTGIRFFLIKRRVKGVVKIVPEAEPFFKKVKTLAKDQKWILRSAVSATKVGGMIVYSTCTISPEENEGVIDWILKKEKGKLRVETIVLPGIQTMQGIEKCLDETYSPEVKKTLRIIPSVNMEGFFVAKLKKIKSTVSQLPKVS